MSVSKRDTLLYRQDEKAGYKLTPEERIRMLKPYLPPPPERSPPRAQNGKRRSLGAGTAAGSSRTSSGANGAKPPVGDFDSLLTKRPPLLGVRRFIANQLHILVFTIIHAIFSLYIRIRQGYHGVRDRIYSVLKYHHRTPEIIARDVRDLRRLPKHLSVVLTLEENARGGAELERLVNEVSDLTAWCASAGIPMLSVYEKTGILKSYLAETHRAVSQRLSVYFGRVHPALTLQAPHLPSIESTSHGREYGSGEDDQGHISVLLLSAEDGRDSLVDLTKTLAEMAQRSKISASDISIDLVDAELTESIMGEPDLLLLFGPYVELDGYPPWQVRLTEIYYVLDNQGVGYQVFLWGLSNYAKAEMRVGK